VDLGLMLEDKASVSLIVACIALAGVIMTGIVSLLVARRSTYLNAVTAERSKWIDKLRNNIAEMLAVAHELDAKLYRDRDGEFQSSHDYDKLTREAAEKIALLRLQLNPEGSIDRNILSLLAALRARVGDQDYSNFERVFVRHVQSLLKEEWEKVKCEAHGWFGRLWALYQRHRRKVAYEKFCKTEEGEISRWIE
jgi:hypothetical protein